MIAFFHVTFTVTKDIPTDIQFNLNSVLESLLDGLPFELETEREQHGFIECHLYSDHYVGIEFDDFVTNLRRQLTPYKDYIERCDVFLVTQKERLL